MREAGAGEPLLSVRRLNAWYGESHILHGVDFAVPEGEVVTLLGRNGAGKTTTMKSIMGIVGQRKGSVRFEGQELIGKQSNQIARAGIALCPEERGIFANLSVEENLTLPPVVRMPAVSVTSLMPIGSPCSGPSVSPRITASPAASAASRASSAASVTMALSVGLTRAMTFRCASSTSTGVISRDLISATNSPADFRVRLALGISKTSTPRFCHGRACPGHLA